MFVATGEFGKLIKDARKTQMSQTALAKAIDVSPARLSNWERGVHDPEPEFIRRMASVLKVPLTYFWPKLAQIPGETVANTETGVYNNSSRVDSNPDPLAVDTAKQTSDPRTVRAAVLLGDGASIWSAKGARREFVHIYAFAARGNELIQISELSLSPRFWPGTILTFESSSFPATGIMLLLANKKNPDQRTIRYIDPAGRPDRLLPALDGAPDDTLTDWDVIGFASVETWMEGGIPKSNVRPSGVKWSDRN